MKWLSSYRMRLVLVGCVAAIVLGGGESKAEIIMSEPTNVGPTINDAYDVQECDFSHDGLELYFSANRPGQYGKRDIYMAKRETITSPWHEPVNLGQNVNSSGSEVEPSISGDGLELYLGCWDDWNLRVCTRSYKDAPWSRPVKVGPPVGSNEPAMEVGSNDVWGPDISADGLSLYFNSTRAGGYGGNDIWVAKRATINDEWDEPINLGPNINSGSGDNEPCVSSDGLTLIFNRGLRNMMAATRKSINDDWGPAVDLGFPAPGNFYGPAISPDGSTIYFDAAAPWGGYGDNDIWQVKFIPIVDFNSDEIVDIADLVILIEHWGKQEALCDVGPLPLGDGRVDEADLKVFMSHWGQEAYDPALIARWKLDETEGAVAHDGIGANDATVVGDPVWQPKGGMVDGAIALDGMDDYIQAPFVLSPLDGAFSVFAWVKGGALGQVVLSQADGSNWLCLDSVEGCLMTELKAKGRGAAGPLVSQAVITDGTWHRIGLVWDGSCRHLYVDRVDVAKDAASLSALEDANGGLYFGAGSTLTPGTFFSGLIDDIRIYNRAVSP